MKDDKLYLIHIRECIERIESYVSDGERAFMESRLIQDGVLRNLQTLAESTQRLSDEIKGEYSEIDWRRITGFRNILVHDYLGLDVQLIWAIVRNELPSLKLAIESMLHD